jgi:putative acetyltransferase
MPERATPKDVTLSIRAYRHDDLDAVIAIFLGAIRQIAARDYNQAQIDAWAQADRDAWTVRRFDRPTWVAIISETIVGFADLEADGHLDMMFVDPAHQRMGVASALYETIETHARMQGLHEISTEASITARPFFERRGFSVLSAQLVEKRGQILKNFTMKKILRSIDAV